MSLILRKSEDEQSLLSHYTSSSDETYDSSDFEQPHRIEIDYANDPNRDCLRVGDLQGRRVTVIPPRKGLNGIETVANVGIVFVASVVLSCIFFVILQLAETSHCVDNRLGRITKVNNGTLSEPSSGSGDGFCHATYNIPLTVVLTTAPPVVGVCISTAYVAFKYYRVRNINRERNCREGELHAAIETLDPAAPVPDAILKENFSLLQDEYIKKMDWRQLHSCEEEHYDAIITALDGSKLGDVEAFYYKKIRLLKRMSADSFLNSYKTDPILKQNLQTYPELASIMVEYLPEQITNKEEIYEQLRSIAEISSDDSDSNSHQKSDLTGDAGPSSSTLNRESIDDDYFIFEMEKIPLKLLIEECGYFKAARDLKRINDEEITLIDDDVDQFRLMLQLINGKKTLDNENIMEAASVSLKYGAEHLLKKCEEFLIQNRSKYKREKLLKYAEKYSFNDLKRQIFYDLKIQMLQISISDPKMTAYIDLCKKYRNFQILEDIVIQAILRKMSSKFFCWGMKDPDRLVTIKTLCNINEIVHLPEVNAKELFCKKIDVCIESYITSPDSLAQLWEFAKVADVEILKNRIGEYCKKNPTIADDAWATLPHEIGALLK